MAARCVPGPRGRGLPWGSESRLASLPSGPVRSPTVPAPAPPSHSCSEPAPDAKGSWRPPWGYPGPRLGSSVWLQAPQLARTRKLLSQGRRWSCSPAQQPSMLRSPAPIAKPSVAPRWTRHPGARRHVRLLAEARCSPVLFRGPSSSPFPPRTLSTLAHLSTVAWHTTWGSSPLLACLPLAWPVCPGPQGRHGA